MGGLKNKLCFNNSLHQTAAADRLSPVCIEPVSELRLQFESDSSAAAVRLSPELSGLNKESSSTVSEQPDAVETHDKQIDYFEMTLNNHHIILMNQQESKQESVDFQEQESHLSDSQRSDESSIQETKDSDLNSDESERPQVSEDFTNSSDEETITQDYNNASEMIDCRECEIKSEEEQKSSDCTVAAVRLDPVTTLVKDYTPSVRPSIHKRKEQQPLTTPQIVFRERPPRKPPDNNFIKQDGK